jgi:hypothetical protein
MLWLNALERGSPGLWFLLTTRETWTDGDRFRRAFDHVFRAVRRRWPDAEYAALLEFTTGYGPRSGGKRRPHWNVFLYGVPVDERRELWHVVTRVWCERVDAAAHQQRVYRVAADKGGMRGLSRYVGLHFQKESQAPPAGWSGQRFRASRGFFVRSRQELRQEARKRLTIKRRIWRLQQEHPALDPGEALTVAELEQELAELDRWELVEVRRRPGSRVIEPVGIVGGH